MGIRIKSLQHHQPKTGYNPQITICINLCITLLSTQIHQVVNSFVFTKIKLQLILLNKYKYL